MRAVYAPLALAATVGLGSGMWHGTIGCAQRWWLSVLLRESGVWKRRWLQILQWPPRRRGGGSKFRSANFCSDSGGVFKTVNMVLEPPCLAEVERGAPRRCE
ncbi:hypothetical protein B0H13DRAFT_2123956 [Mycena leptocephala]|nr:hypothetical protein B0H13DRAFT_2123956 [Mycena leptocephala]